MSIPSHTRVSLRIQGKVQGVFFRESARQEAARLGITGWVRNLSDGSVEAVAEGPSDLVAAFVKWCDQGPPSAHVTDVQSKPSDATGEFDTFRVERSR